MPRVARLGWQAVGQGGACQTLATGKRGPSLEIVTPGMDRRQGLAPECQPLLATGLLVRAPFWPRGDRRHGLAPETPRAWQDCGPLAIVAVMVGPRPQKAKIRRNGETVSIPCECFTTRGPAAAILAPRPRGRNLNFSQQRRLMRIDATNRWGRSYHRVSIRFMRRSTCSRMSTFVSNRFACTRAVLAPNVK